VIANFAKMRDYNPSRQSLNYMLCDSVVADTFARLATARNRPQQTNDKHHSFQHPGVDQRTLDRIHVSLRAVGIDASVLTNQELATMIESAKTLNRGRAGFIPAKIKTGAQAIQEILK
jgi:hypothetical protein